MDTSNIPGKQVNSKKLLEKRNLPDLEDARNQLIDSLNNLHLFDEKVLAAIAAVPRHAFAPPALWRMAYADIELWGPSAFLPRPSIVARIAQAVLDGNANTVLEYATGTGYVTTILSLLTDKVFTVEHDPWQLWLSSDAFRELEINNISQKSSDGRLGWPEHAPFDAIVVCAAIPDMLKAFTDQLTDSGTLIAPIGSYYGPHHLKTWNQQEGTPHIADLAPCFFPPLTGVWRPDVHTDVKSDETSSSFWDATKQGAHLSWPLSASDPFVSAAPIEGAFDITPPDEPIV
ncbi:protein-L-isoaspartate O-methyltransferase family protein [Chitinophaga pinensis]|nr:protein-L-isoaspartate O-methyltransferase [Chitinophaga pinensis]